MKPVVVIAFYVWLALTVAIVLGRLARWTASRQAAKRRRKARALARSEGDSMPVMVSEPADDSIDLDTAFRPPVATRLDRNQVPERLGEPASFEPSAETSTAAEDEQAAETADESAERRAAERRALDRRVEDRRSADRRTTEPAAASSNGHTTPAATPAARPAETTPQEPALPAEQPVPMQAPAFVPESAPAPAPAPAPMHVPLPAPAPAPADVPIGQTISQLLRGITIPPDLVPIAPVGAPNSDQSVALISRQRPAYEVGSGVADELERLGYLLSPVGEAALLATRGADVLSVEIDPAPHQADATGRVRFPAATSTDVVVEFWVGSGPRPT